MFENTLSHERCTAVHSPSMIAMICRATKYQSRMPPEQFCLASEPCRIHRAAKLGTKLAPTIIRLCKAEWTQADKLLTASNVKSSCIMWSTIAQSADLLSRMANGGPIFRFRSLVDRSLPGNVVVFGRCIP